MEDQAVTNFRDYLRINTMQPTPDYKSAVIWLKLQAQELDAEFQVTECVPGKPVVLLSIRGKEPDLPSILLNSHTDVVPVFAEHWKYEPFSAHKDEEGNIFARGSQDMKCVGVQYLEAMRKLKKEGVRLIRTVHMSFVPDEEIGGGMGMCEFLKTEVFKNLNVGFGLDEGYASSDEDFFVFYGERNAWELYVKCPGVPGHGSQFLADNAGQKIRKIIDKFMDFRDQEEKKLKLNPDCTLGDVTTVNLTFLRGGVQFNVVPDELTAGFNVRIPPTVNLVQFEQMIDRWCKEVADDIWVGYNSKHMSQNVTCVEDGKSEWWDAFKAACMKEKINVKKQIFPAATDSCFIRELGIPVLGFSPMNNTPLLLHDHNEFLNEKVFLRGIDIYKTIISHLASLKA